MSEARIERILARVRRDLLFSGAIKFFLFILLAMGLSGWIPIIETTGAPWISIAIIIGVAVAWVYLSYLSLRQGKAATLSSELLAAGRYEHAESCLLEACESFSFHRGLKMAACHNLALLAHARNEFRQAADACRIVLRRKRGVFRAVVKMSHLILADSLLRLGELHDVHRMLESAKKHDLTLAERLIYEEIELRYLLKIGRSDHVVHDLQHRVRLAELLPSQKAAAQHALLAEACRFSGHLAMKEFLWSRACLYADPENYSSEIEQFATEGNGSRAMNSEAIA
jgi:hypothetical protein